MQDRHRLAAVPEQHQHARGGNDDGQQPEVRRLEQMCHPAEPPLPAAAAKTRVITNAYPPMPTAPLAEHAGVRRVALVHGGRFSGSDPRRSPALLLEPLLQALTRNPRWRGSICLPGDHSVADRAQIETYQSAFGKLGWELPAPSLMERSALGQLLQGSAGLLLIAAAYSPIPGKLFEYLPTGRPVLAIVPEGGAVWQLCEGFPQVFLLDPLQANTHPAVVDRFLEAAASERLWPAPTGYSDDAVRCKFLEVLGE